MKKKTGLKLKNVEGYLGFFEYFSGGGLLTRQFNFQVSVAALHVIQLMEHEDYVWSQPGEVETLPISDDTLDVIRNLF